MRGGEAVQRCLVGLIGIAVLPTAIAGDGPESVSFKAADGFWLYADFCRPKSSYTDPPMVILLNVGGHDRQDWNLLLEPLREAGCAVLAMDLRGSGQSATTSTRERLEQGDAKLFREMQDDLRGAYDWLAAQKGLDRSRFALVASGVGGGVATRYAAQDRSVDALIWLSPATEKGGLDPRGDFGQLRGRSILLVDVEEARPACERLATAAEHVAQRYCAGKERGIELLSQEPKLRKEIIDFLLRGVGPPSSNMVCGSLERPIYHRLDSGWLTRIDPSNLRYYSSPQEAEARGLRAAKNTGPQDRPARRPSGTPRP